MSKAANGFSIRNLSAGYPGRAVLEDVSITPVENGGLVALLGPNGAGKSTLLRAMAGLVKARGQVMLAGDDLLALPARLKARRMGFVPQGLPADVTLDVLDCALAGLKHLRPELSDEAASRATLAALERLGGAHLALEPMQRLSGGQRQIASLAGAIAARQPLLLLDEPTSALDLGHRFRVMRLLRALADEGRVIVTVLHEIDQAAEWADRLVVLDRGRVIADGAPKEVLTRDLLRKAWGVRAEFGGEPPHIRITGLEEEP